MVELTIAFITGVISPVTLLLIKNKLEKNKKSDIVKDALHVSEIVTNKIDEIREDVNADRVWITQFHNGGHFYPTGKSITKFSVIYETVGIGVSSIQGNFQNIPVYLFSKSMNELVKSNHIRIYDFNDETIATFGLKNVAEETDLKSSYLFAIKNIENKFIGVLGIDYVNEKVNLEKEVITDLLLKSTSLGGILMEH